MARLTALLLGLVQHLVLTGFANGYPGMLHPLQARQINTGQLRSAYDYIIVGGGQSGLVIANRLSEDSKKSVLVVEYGYLENDAAQLEPSSATNYKSIYLYNVTSERAPNIGNKASQAYAAAVVGGGSTVNGMMFDRASKNNYNDWAKLGNPGWDWNGLLPYFKKSTTFTPPRADLAAEFNITWDVSAAYGNGPIDVTFPDWQWPTIKAQWKGWAEVGVPKMKEGGGGDAYNTFWVPSNVDQQYRRSYARNRYFDPVKSRTNLHLLTGYRVNEVQFSSSKRAESVTVQARGTSNGAATIKVKAAQEIVLCAGWLHTPQVLQRSGIGPSALLNSANIPVLVENDGVGANLQDHPAFSASYQYRSDMTPNQQSMYTNASFSQWVQQQWAQRKGPSSMGVGNALAVVPWPTLGQSSWQSLITKVRGQSSAQYLPKSYTAANIKGYEAQRDILLTSFSQTDNGVCEIPFSGGGMTSLVLERPFSRGTVLLRTNDKYAEPIVDYNTNANPADSDVMVATLKMVRRWHQAPSMQALTPVESQPGTGVQTDTQIASYAAQGATGSTAHSCCTAAMAPRELAGVVSPELLVYGVTGLSVGDISIMPMIPATHTCSSVYAVAEKAADLIQARYDSSIPPAEGTPVTTQPSGPTSTTTTPGTGPTQPPGCAVQKYGQCGGQGYSGCTTCASGSTCTVSNQWYSQCL